MQNENIENYMEFLLSVALKKCGNMYDAEELVQETLLAGIVYRSKGNVIQNMQAWLLTVMNHKFHDMLRKKYHQPVVYFGEDFNKIEEVVFIDEAEIEHEKERVRKAVAYLAKTYREVIVRYYMNGQSVMEIASELGLPEGTVKSRLHFGRIHVKRGISDMERYSKQSYSPITLDISCSGRLGQNGEPFNLVDDDLIVQNILWFAYAKPITMEEISLAIGIPTAYVEPIVQKLVDGELMKKVGTKYYTDFMISTIEDKEKYISQQKQVVHENFDLFWSAIENVLQKLKEKEFYQRCSFDAKNSLELYVAFYCLDYGIYSAFQSIFETEQNFVDRPQSGRWIAFGQVNFKDFNPKEHMDLLAHSYSGERWVRLDKFLDSEQIELHAYGADGFPSYSYSRLENYTCFPKHTFIDAEIAKLIYIVDTGVNLATIDFNLEYLKAIPWLTKCKIFREEEGKPVVNIPILRKSESQQLWNLCAEAKQSMVEQLKPLLKKFLKGKKQNIPAHLNSVPLQKQYLNAMNAMLFATIREAIKRGNLYDGNYDDDSNGVNQVPCPMVFIIEKYL